MRLSPKWSWILYDFGNSAFATSVVAGFFPVFFKKYWSSSVDPHVSTSRLGFALAFAGVVMAVLAPIWGRKSDIAQSRKQWLAVFAGLGCVMCASLFWVPEGAWGWAIAAYVLTYIGFEASVIFYDSLLVDVAEPKDFHKFSSMGFAFGYLGGGLLFLLNVMMTLFPQNFGFSSVAEAVQFSFLLVAMWWGIFTAILVWGVHEQPRPKAPPESHWRETFQHLAKTFRDLWKQRNIFYFLLAYWFYIDGVYTIYTMAVDYGLSLGLEQADLMKALLLTQFVGFPSALAFGFLSRHFATKRLLMICLMVYIAVLVYSTQLKSGTDFMILAGCVGLVQGGIQSLSRSYFAHLIPANQSAEYFGFYNIIGKSASFMGPFVVALVTVITGTTRWSMLSISVLFLLGALLLSRTVMDDHRSH